MEKRWEAEEMGAGVREIEKQAAGTEAGDLWD